MENATFGIQVNLETPDSFLLTKETLTRIGIQSIGNKTLYQSCHILHKRGLYYIVHFKEMFKLDGKPCNITEDDIQRRNLIATLLHDWKLVKIVSDDVLVKAPVGSIKILTHDEKKLWILKSKYSIGNTK